MGEKSTSKMDSIGLLISDSVEWIYGANNPKVRHQYLGISWPGYRYIYNAILPYHYDTNGDK